MREESKVDPGLLNHFLTESLSSEEQARVLAWLADGKDPNAPSKYEIDGAVVNFRQALADESLLPSNGIVVRKSNVTRYLGVTAGLIVLVAGAIHLAPMLLNKGLTARTYTTVAGQRATVTLSDGSQVTLAPATALTVSDKSSRSIHLDGEAVFTVTQRIDVPFTVRTANSVTRVLGTTFSVRQYASETTTRVAVAEGKVSVNNALLTTGDVAGVSSNSDTRVVHGQDISALLGWTTGRLTFRDAAVSDVMKELARWYSTKLTVDSALLNEHITAELPADAADRAITYLADVLGARAEHNGNAIHFQKNITSNRSTR